MTLLQTSKELRSHHPRPILPCSYRATDWRQKREAKVTRGIYRLPPQRHALYTGCIKTAGRRGSNHESGRLMHALIDGHYGPLIRT